MITSTSQVWKWSLSRVNELVHGDASRKCSTCLAQKHLCTKAHALPFLEARFTEISGCPHSKTLRKGNVSWLGSTLQAPPHHHHPPPPAPRPRSHRAALRSEEEGHILASQRAISPTLSLASLLHPVERLIRPSCFCRPPFPFHNSHWRPPQI